MQLTQDDGGDAPEGKIIFLMGPSGVGKNTLKDHVKKVFNDRLMYPVSYTSRAMRPGETEGVTYHYVTRKVFKRMIRKGVFFEWAEYGGNYYGTLRSFVNVGLAAGKVLFADLEKHGYEQIVQHYPRERYHLIFIVAGTWEIREARIRARATISDEELALRKLADKDMITIMSEADEIVINRDGKLDEAKCQIESAVRRIME